jgi:hypothetical protein
VSACKSCGAEIIWAKTTAGKVMPLDEKPITLFVLDGEGSLNRANAEIKSSVVGRTSHFATCPQADQHRRPR